MAVDTFLTVFMMKQRISRVNVVGVSEGTVLFDTEKAP